MNTKYFLVNKKGGLIGGGDYGSFEAAEAAIPKSNIPDAKAIEFKINYLNDCYIHPENHLNHNDPEKRQVYFDKKKALLQCILAQIKNMSN